MRRWLRRRPHDFSRSGDDDHLGGFRGGHQRHLGCWCSRNRSGVVTWDHDDLRCGWRKQHHLLRPASGSDHHHTRPRRFRHWRQDHPTYRGLLRRYRAAEPNYGRIFRRNRNRRSTHNGLFWRHRASEAPNRRLLRRLARSNGWTRRSRGSRAVSVTERRQTVERQGVPQLDDAETAFRLARTRASTSAAACVCNGCETVAREWVAELGDECTVSCAIAAATRWLAAIG